MVLPYGWMGCLNLNSEFSIMYLCSSTKIALSHFFPHSPVVCSRRAIRSARSSFELSRLTDNRLKFSGVQGLVALIARLSAVPATELDSPRPSTSLENAPEAPHRRSAPSADDKVFCAVLTRSRRIFVLRRSALYVLPGAVVLLCLGSTTPRWRCPPLAWLLPRLARLLCV